MFLRFLTLFLCLTRPAWACDLALALAVDVSGSVDSSEYRIQMDGLAAGLRDPIVSEALVRGQARVMLVQWTGESRQRVTIPWTKIDSFIALEKFADQVAQDPRVWRNFSTAIGEALEATLLRFDDVAECRRLLIDISGDGVSNEGVEPTQIHTLLKDRGVTVNAIAIEESEPDLTAYFFENVIFGEGAFVVSASGFADYPERIRKKLLREVTQQSAGFR
jgi:Ca-activated chloride channel family protein